MDNNSTTNEENNNNENNTDNTSLTTNIDPFSILSEDYSSKFSDEYFNLIFLKTPSDFLFLSSHFLYQEIELLLFLAQNSIDDRRQFLILLKNYIVLFHDLLNLRFDRDQLVVNHYSDYIELLSRGQIRYNRILFINESSDDNNDTRSSNEQYSTFSSVQSLLDEFNRLRCSIS